MWEGTKPCHLDCALLHLDVELRSRKTKPCHLDYAPLHLDVELRSINIKVDSSRRINSPGAIYFYICTA